MKIIISALLLTGTLGAHSGVHAQNSTLRVACKGNDVGAEVTIDGQFKGECPLEARVRAGTVKLRLVKKVDSLRERVFEQDIRLGDGVVKQVDAVLPEPRLTAQAQRGKGARLALEAGKPAKRDQVRQAAAIDEKRRESERLALEAADAAKREQARVAGLTEEQRRDEVELPQQMKAAAAGDASAMALLGARYETGKGVPQSDELAVNWYRKSAEAGDTVGMAGLGAMYYYGTGFPSMMPKYHGTKDEENETQARIWWSKAAEAGNGRAMNGMGSLYYFGQAGLPEDKARALAWYEKAAAAGEPLGMLSLGTHHLAVTLNYERALFYYRKASDAGSPRGMINLGSMYDRGYGVAKDELEALSWYRKAAATGSADGMFLIGYFYASGKGVAKDENEAASWFRKAGTAGNLSGWAVESLWKRYTEGDGVPKDEAEAETWRQRLFTGGGNYFADVHRKSREQALEQQQKAAEVAAAAADNAARARQNIAAAERRPAQAEKPASSGSGFFGAMLGGLASRVVDRTASQINSQAAGSGNAVLGALASANTQLANASKEQIARDMGSNDSVEGMAGAMVGSALGSGSMAGAVNSLSGAAAGSGNSNSGSSGSGGGDNWSGVRNEISGLMGQSRTAGNASARSLASAGAVVGSCSTAASGGFADQLQGRFNKYKSDGQCGPIVQSAEALRVRAIANCKAGDTRSADIIYGTQYLRQMIPYVKSACP